MLVGIVWFRKSFRGVGGGSLDGGKTKITCIWHGWFEPWRLYMAGCGKRIMMAPCQRLGGVIIICGDVRQKATTTTHHSHEMPSYYILHVLFNKIDSKMIDHSLIKFLLDSFFFNDTIWDNICLSQYIMSFCSLRKAHSLSCRDWNFSLSTYLALNWILRRSL